MSSASSSETQAYLTSRRPAARTAAPVLGIHTHDDGGVAVANALAARARRLRRRCRARSTAMASGWATAISCSVIPDLAAQDGLSLSARTVNWRASPKLSRFVSETANLAPDPRQPFVGASAFAHKGGIHVAAILKVEESYQHIDPTLVGNEKRVLVSELSGRGNLVYKAQEFGLDASKDEVRQVLAQIKELESRGFYFEGAEASVALMLHRLQPDYRPPFELIDFMVVVEHRQGRGLFAEATVKVRVGDEIAHTVAEGNGPVNALDQGVAQGAAAALPATRRRPTERLQGPHPGRRCRHQRHHPRHHRHQATATASWSTVGSSTNIIESSWQALADSMEYALVAVHSNAVPE